MAIKTCKNCTSDSVREKFLQEACECQITDIPQPSVRVQSIGKSSVTDVTFAIENLYYIYIKPSVYFPKPLWIESRHQKKISFPFKMRKIHMHTGCDKKDTVFKDVLCRISVN